MNILKSTLDHLRATQEWYTREKVYDRWPLSPIWKNNMAQHFNPLLSSLKGDEDPVPVLQFLHDKAFFDVSVAQPQLKYALQWFIDHKLATPFDDGLGESEIFPENRRLKNDYGRWKSTDIVWRAALYDRIENCRGFSERWPHKCIVELGSGCGNFARAWKLRQSLAQYVLIDLPESLFFAETFLRLEFPGAKFQYITSPDDVCDFSASFVFCPTEFAEGVLAGQPVDLFVNMNSLGEMPNASITRWMAFVEHVTDTKRIFMLNRFLNRITPGMAEYRHKESSCSLALGKDWRVTDWEVDPLFERSPYGATLLTRNLLIQAVKVAEPPAAPDLTAISQEDWVRRLGWSNYKLEEGQPYPPLNSRADLCLTHDLTINGTLFKLWEAYRLTGYKDPLVHWLATVGGQQTPFEEIFCLLEERQGGA